MAIALSIIKKKVAGFWQDIRKLEGDPNYVASGMALGVFIGITPTFPLHTILALALAFCFKASKPAAVIGVWFGNPFTMPFFYYLSYRIGIFFLDRPSPFSEKYGSILELVHMGFDVTVAMLLGGVIVAIIPALLTYGLTFYIVKKIRKKSAAKRLQDNK